MTPPKGTAGSPQAALSSSALAITRIETVPVMAPLCRDFRGSNYHMTQRATLVTRVHTADGIVGEAYAGDEDSTLLDIERIVHQEIAPRLIGIDAMATERCWAAGFPATLDILRDRRLGLVALAGVDAANLGRRGQGPRHPTLAAVGRIPAPHPPDRDRWLLRRTAWHHPRRDRCLQGTGTRRRQVQGWRTFAGRGRRTCRRGKGGGRRSLRRGDRR